MQTIKENTIIELDITGLTHEGAGVGRYNGMAIFVTGALPGERVQAQITEVKKQFARAKQVQVVQPSAERVEPVCPSFGHCGGCQLQHAEYKHQLELKTQLVKDSLTRIGKFTDPLVQRTLGMRNPEHYRNKVVYQVTTVAGQLKLGFFAEDSHQVVGVAQCQLVDKELLEIADVVEGLLNKYGVTAYDWSTGQGQLRHLVLRRGQFTGEIMVIFVTGAQPFEQGVRLAKELMNSQPAVISVIHNVNTAGNRMIIGTDWHVLGGRMQLWERLEECTYAISPGAFFQVNSKQAVMLYDKVYNFARLTGREIVLDLYCGVGSIGLYLARKALHVVGIEVVSEAIIDAKRNAELNKLRNTQWMSGPVEELLPKFVNKMAAHGKRVDVIVVDPPRKGCDPQVLEVMAQAGAERIVYVSCDPATMARDLRILVDKGYELEQVQPVDMFPGTSHVETVVLMSRKDK